ncbi:hypothetical protein BVRB_5g118190 [Beta vulgaris subsp. vulgaris]|nr:hypothetical protein BVRB_5g118190 [Beta vulgaris subsp. vulgaris]
MVDDLYYHNHLINMFILALLLKQKYRSLHHHKLLS